MMMEEGRWKKSKKRSDNQDGSLWLIRVALESEMFDHKESSSPQSDFRLPEHEGTRPNEILCICRKFLLGGNHVLGVVVSLSLFSLYQCDLL